MKWKTTKEQMQLIRKITQRAVKMIQKSGGVVMERSPWQKTLRSIKVRCNDKKGRYYQKGIKCLITSAQIQMLWVRDKAYLMARPSIDRLDNNKDYSFGNCRFIELSENCRQGGKKMLGKKLPLSTRQKMREARLGHRQSKEIRLKISKSRKGQRLSEEHKKKISASRRKEKLI